MSRNTAFCCLTILAFLTIFARSAIPDDCSVSALSEAWPADEPRPVAAIDAGYWYRASPGWIIAPDACSARTAAVEMAAASAAFARYFGRTAPTGAVVDVSQAANVSALREAGADWVLPWRFGHRPPADPALERSIREQIRGQLAAGGEPADPEQVEALVRQAMSKLDAVEAPAEPVLETKAMRHEVAHLLFTRSIWPSTTPRVEQYGGDAPDWLDEAAAIVAESQAMTEARRARFAQLAAERATIPLEAYLQMPHPVFADANLQALVSRAREQAQAGGAAIVSASLDPGDGGQALDYYAQTRGFVDYLIERTRNERVLEDVALFMREEGSFDQWLSREGQPRELPKGVAQLEEDFLRFGAVQR